MAVKLNPASLDWALNHVEKFGDTDIFPPAFEFKVIREFWNALPAGGPKQRVRFREFLATLDLLSWTMRPPRRCLSPKHQFGFRASTQLDPLDAILFTALVYEIGIDLESTRVPSDEAVVHSYRFSTTPDGQMFDPEFSYGSFCERSVELAYELDNDFVVVADIADFYPRIYSHPLENALAEATPKKDHVAALKQMLLQLNQTVSYGIPVGPSASRLLAEIAIADVDAALRSEGFVHTRFVDDFRIFCKTERDAFSALAFLANTLFDHHGLTLQQHKTFIQTSAKFIANNSATESDNERESLSARFQSILNKIGINNPYETLEYEDVDSQTKADIDALNLSGILREQIDSNEQLDIPMTKFVLKRLTQLSDDQVVDVILANIRRLYPVFKECLLYLTSVRSGPFDDRHEFGERLLNLISHDVVGHLEFHRAWILSAFADDGDWGNAERFVPIYNQFSDSLTRREAILALGRSGHPLGQREEEADWKF